MSERCTLESPFGRLVAEVLDGALPPLAKSSRKHGCGGGATHTSIPVVALVDPSPAVLDLVAPHCFRRSPARCALTRWHAPGGPSHTKLLFFCSDPAEALRLLEEAAQDAQETRAPQHVLPDSTEAGL